MKRIKKTNGKALLYMMLCVLLCSSTMACGNAESILSKTNNEKVVVDYGMQDNRMMDEESIEESKALSGEEAAGADSSADSGNGESTTAAVKNDSQKIIKKYYYDYETEKVDDAYAYLKNQIQKYQGYISESEISGTGYRTLRMTARIPADVSDDFVSTMGSLGTVVSQSESAEDVTLQYADTESRITSLKTEQERLNELLEKADNLENIIALEDRLTEVRYQLENYQSQKNLYDALIAYSTISITLEEVNYTVAIDDSTFLSRISTGLENSFREIRNGFVNFLVAFIVALPYLVIWAVVLVIMIWIIRKMIKRRGVKKQKRMNQELSSAAPKEMDCDRNRTDAVSKVDTAYEENSTIEKE